MSNRGSLLRLLAILGITAIWGWTFVVVKDAVAAFPVAAFLAYRFALAVALWTPFLRHLRWRSVVAGSWIGIFMGVAFVVQTLGLHLTLASDAGLITGLFVVLVPAIEWVVFRVRVPTVTLAGVGLALIGLVLLVGALPRQLAIGDLLVALSAFGFAVQIILVARFSHHHDSISLTVGQTASALAIFVVAALLPMGGGFPMPPASVLVAIAITASLATALGLFVQVWAQRQLAATTSAIVLLTEPAWATFFGVVLSGNPFPPIRIAGAALLFATPLFVTLAALRPRRRLTQTQLEEPIDTEVAVAG
ncbi:MAG TPA: DMT family transporter [Candidatus Dormibacteraeota bacterium]